MLSLFISTSQSIIKTPTKYNGLVYNDNDGAIVLEAFVDPLCPACLAIWPLIDTLLKKYPTQVQVIAHMIPLPYHTWAVEVTKAIMAAKEINIEAARTFLSNLYLKSDQDLFSNSALKDLTFEQVDQKIIEYGANVCGVSEAEFKEKYDASTGGSSEYSFSSQIGVASTPIIYINGVACDAINSDTTIQEATKIIDNLLKKTPIYY